MNRRTKAQWRELILQQQSSGLNAAEFCRRESINPKYFSVRKKQLSDVPSSFIEVTSPTAPMIETSVCTIKVRVIEFEIPLTDLGETLKQLRR